MGWIKFYIEGIKRGQEKELIENLQSIEGIGARQYVEELELKEMVVPIMINIGVSVASALITHYIIKFFEKERSRDNKPIVIKGGNVQIIQGDNKEEIENKINVILERK